VNALVSMAEFHVKKGDYKKAVEAFKEAAAKQEDSGDKEGQADTLQQAAELLMNAGDNQCALELAKPAVAIFKVLGSRWRLGVTLRIHASIQLNLATLEFQKGKSMNDSINRQLRDALLKVDEAVALLRQLGQESEKQDLAEALLIAARILLALEFSSNALQFAAEAGTYFQEVGNSYGLAMALLSVARASILENQFDNADQAAEEAKVMFNEGGCADEAMKQQKSSIWRIRRGSKFCDTSSGKNSHLVIGNH